MVTQPVYYYRFDEKEWMNPDTYTVEKFLNFVDRYYVSDSVVSFQNSEDIDYKSDNIRLQIATSFFNNPTRNPIFENSVDDLNSFEPRVGHAIIMGPMLSVDNEDDYNTKLVIGLVQSVTQTNSDKYDFVCSGLISVLAGRQAGTEYHYDLSTKLASHFENSTKCLPDDDPNKEGLYYNDVPYLTRAEQDKTYTWNRRSNSDPAFPEPLTGANTFYPYAIYSMEGTAIRDGNVVISIQKPEGDPDDNPRSFQIDFQAGDSAEYVLSQMLQYNINENVNSSTVPDYKENGVIKSNEIFRLSQRNNSIIVQSLYAETDSDTQYYLRNLPNAGITVTDNSGFKVDYIYYGKSIGTSSTSSSDTPPEEGRSKIRNYDADISLTAETSPFYPIDLYGVRFLDVNGNTVVQRDAYSGYSLNKVAWRLLKDIGWVRVPYFSDCNPYMKDYDENSFRLSYDTYDMDGLKIDFPETILIDFNEYLYLPYYISFDSSKQSYAYNLKTISDAQGMFINAQIRPRLVNNTPIWDDSIYNLPTSCIIDVEGYCPKQSIDITLNVPTVTENGTKTLAYVYLPSIERKTTKEIAARLEYLLREDVNIAREYNILRYGNKIYLETNNLDIATHMLTDDDFKFAQDVKSSDTNSNIIRLIFNTHVARVDSKERLAEKIYYLRRWGIIPGFHPKVYIRHSPNEKLTPPEPEITIKYSAEDTDVKISTAPTFASSPSWTRVTGDMINKAIVKYLSNDETEVGYAVFPSSSKQYKYFALHIKGISSANQVKTTLSLTIGVNGVRYTGSIDTILSSGMSAAKTATLYNARVLTINVASKTYQFPVSANGEYIYISSDYYTNNFLQDTAQVEFTVSTTESTLYCDRKELVQEEPSIFDEARDSQAINGIKDISLTLPESKSINDTMNFVSSIFKKYLNPKYQCIGELNMPDGWHLPLFTYVNIKDYVSTNTDKQNVEWYADALITDSADQDQNIVLAFSYDDGTYSRVIVPISNGDTPDIIASKIAKATSEDNELSNYDISIDGGYLRFVPKLNYDADSSFHPIPPSLPSDYIDTSYIDASTPTAPTTGGSTTTGGSGANQTGGGSGAGSTTGIKVDSGSLVDKDGNALPVLRGINDSGTMPLFIAARGGSVSPGSTGIITYSTWVNSGSREEVARFFYRYGMSMKAHASAFNFIRIGCHEHNSFDKVWTTWCYDQKNGTTYVKDFMEAMCKGFEAAEVYYSIGPFAGYSDFRYDENGNLRQRFVSKSLNKDQTSIGSFCSYDMSIRVSDATNEATSYVEDCILNKNSNSFSNFIDMLVDIQNNIGGYPHLVCMEIANEPDLMIYKKKWWSAYYQSSLPNSMMEYQGLAHNAFKNWISAAVTGIKTKRTKGTLLSNGATPFDGDASYWWDIHGYPWTNANPQIPGRVGVMNPIQTILDLAGSLDIVGLHHYHMPVELVDNPPKDGNGNYIEATSESQITINNFCTNLYNTCKSAGKPVYVNEWGMHLGSNQAWVGAKATSFETHGIPHACIVGPSKVSVSDSYTLPSTWDTSTPSGGTSTPTVLDFAYTVYSGGVVKNASGSTVHTGTDTESLQWAIENATSANKAVKVDAGSFSITSKVFISCSLVGAGKNSTRFYAGGSIYTSTTGYGSMFQVSTATGGSVSNLQVKDFEIDGQSATYVNSRFGGIDLVKASNCIISDLYVHDLPYSHGIGLQAAQSNTIQNCTINNIGISSVDNSRGAGIWAGATYTTANNYNNLINNCVITNCTEACITLEPANNNTIQGCSLGKCLGYYKRDTSGTTTGVLPVNVIIRNASGMSPANYNLIKSTSFSNEGFNIWIGSSYNEVTNSNIVVSALDSVGNGSSILIEGDLGASSNNIHDNTIKFVSEDSTGDVDAYGIGIRQSNNNTIRANDIYHTSGEGGTYGIVIVDGNYNTIKSNKTHSCTQVVYNQGSNNTIDGNSAL